MGCLDNCKDCSDDLLNCLEDNYGDSAASTKCHTEFEACVDGCEEDESEQLIVGSESD
jgi:hypothetical protein